MILEEKNIENRPEPFYTQWFKFQSGDLPDVNSYLHQFHKKDYRRIETTYENATFCTIFAASHIIDVVRAYCAGRTDERVLNLS